MCFRDAVVSPGEEQTSPESSTHQQVIRSHTFETKSEVSICEQNETHSGGSNPRSSQFNVTADRRMDKEDVVHICNGILLSH